MVKTAKAPVVETKKKLEVKQVEKKETRAASISKDKDNKIKDAKKMKAPEVPKKVKEPEPRRLSSRHAPDNKPKEVVKAPAKVEKPK